MLVAIALACVAVLVSVVVLATGQGGELARVHPDHPPLPLPSEDRITGTDVALLRLPTGVWGYHVDITDEALQRLATVISERDTRIAVLEHQLAELRHAREVDDESVRWNVEREPQSAWAPPGALQAWSGRELPAAPRYEEPDHSEYYERYKRRDPHADHERYEEARPVPDDDVTEPDDGEPGR